MNGRKAPSVNRYLSSMGKSHVCTLSVDVKRYGFCAALSGKTRVAFSLLLRYSALNSTERRHGRCSSTNGPPVQRLGELVEDAVVSTGSLMGVPTWTLYDSGCARIMATLARMK